MSIVSFTEFWNDEPWPEVELWELVDGLHLAIKRWPSPKETRFTEHWTVSPKLDGNHLVRYLKRRFGREPFDIQRLYRPDEYAYRPVDENEDHAPFGGRAFKLRVTKTTNRNPDFNPFHIVMWTNNLYTMGEVMDDALAAKEGFENGAPPLVTWLEERTMRALIRYLEAEYP